MTGLLSVGPWHLVYLRVMMGGSQRLAALVVIAASLAFVPSAVAAGVEPGFGIERFSLTATEVGRAADTQAGSHPYELTAEAMLELSAHGTSGDEVKDLSFELPPGLTLDPSAVPQCSAVQFTGGGCPDSAAVGVAVVSAGGKEYPVAVYGLHPVPGEPAQLGFTLEGVRLLADVTVRTGGDYGMTMSVRDIPRMEVKSLKLTLWGVPSDSTHDALRGSCLTGGGACPSAGGTGAFLTLPGSCAGPLRTALQGESYAAETASWPASFPAMTGCNQLTFDPALSMTPEITQADEPSGYQVRLRVPQSENPVGLAAAQLRDMTVVFPAGVSLGSSSMEGLVGCSEAEFGLASVQRGMCPVASTVGTVELLSGLSEELEGHLYMATPNANPLGAPLALYLEAQGSGLLVKLAGALARNPATGQLKLSFEDVPELSFSDIELAFFGGHDALLTSPPACGTFTAISDLVPWSAGPDAASSSSFGIAMGAGGGPCPPPPPSSSSSSSSSPSSSSSSSSSDPASGSGPGSTTPADVTDSAALTGTRIIATRGGDATVKLTCAGAGTCHGKLTLTVETRDVKGARGVRGGKSYSHASHVKTTMIGTAGFSISAGTTATVRLVLDAAGKALLRSAHGHINATLTILQSGPSQTHNETVRLVR
jgi:hypothetical protein